MKKETIVLICVNKHAGKQCCSILHSKYHCLQNTKIMKIMYNNHTTNTKGSQYNRSVTQCPSRRGTLLLMFLAPLVYHLWGPFLRAQSFDRHRVSRQPYLHSVARDEATLFVRHTITTCHAPVGPQRSRAPGRHLAKRRASRPSSLPSPSCFCCRCCCCPGLDGAGGEAARRFRLLRTALSCFGILATLGSTDSPQGAWRRPQKRPRRGGRGWGWMMGAGIGGGLVSRNSSGDRGGQGGLR